MNPQLSEEEIKNIRWTTIHYLHGTSPNVKIAAKMAFDELLMYKSKVEELQKALEQIYHLRPVACEWTDEKYYEKFAECEDIARQALERSESK